MNMNIQRCVNCMEDMANVSGTVCPKCRFDNAKAAEVQSPYAMRQNTILHGRYLIGNVLGQGGFGITYIAFDLVLGIKVAVKEYFPMGIAMRDPEKSNTLLWHSTQVNTEQRRSGQESFLKEARRIARIDQIPSIVRVRDTFFDNDTSYIVMDFVDGITLKDKLQRGGSISFTECMRYLTPMIEGLSQVHKAGIIHRDISPDNIIIQADGSVKLLDLGAAKDISMGQGQQSQLVAKKGFSPLEQYTETGKIGPWTDVYALCATIYYCVTGRMVPNALDRIGNEGLSFDGMKEPLAAPVREALEAGLVLDAEKRIRSVEELLMRLRGGGVQTQKANGQTEAASNGNKPHAGKPKKKKMWIGILAAALVVFLVIAVSVGGNRENDSAGEMHESSEVQTVETQATEAGAAAGNVEEYGNQDNVLRVESLGTSNANLVNYGGDAVFPGEYEYYISADNALYICPFDQENGSFYLGSNEKISDRAGCITLGKEEVYFVATVSGQEAVCQIDKDGSNMRQLYSAAKGLEMNYLQYVRFSDQSGYLYFLQENEEEGTWGSLYRCNLESGDVEQMIEGELIWYNLYGDSLYYIGLEDASINLYRAGLDGRDSRLLDSKMQYSFGFVEDDALFMYSLRDQAIVVCDLDGSPKSGCEGFYQLELDGSSTFSYGEGWVYYTGRDGNLHRVRGNGTGDSVLAEGISALELCYNQSWLWTMDRQPAEKQHQYKMQVYYIYKDGSNILDINEPEYTWGLPTANEQDFQYETAENEEGVVITGYTGDMTSFQIPGEIDGMPVTAIGGSAFQESAIEEIGLPQGIKEIGNSAFYQCRELTFAGLPEGLETIGVTAFGDCGSITEIDLPDSLTLICNLAFAESSLSQVHIPAGVEIIGAGAFAVPGSTGFSEFTVSSENKVYEALEGVLYERYYDSFDELQPGRQQTLVAVPSGFAGALTIPENVTKIYTNAFAHCRGLLAVVMPSDMLEIRKEVFWDTVIEELIISQECQPPQPEEYEERKTRIGTVNYYSDL